MGTGKHYDEEFKKNAIKLAKEVGNTGAAEELGIPNPDKLEKLYTKPY